MENHIPLSDERLAEIRERAESVRTWKAVWGPPIPQLCGVDVPDLMAEVERLRAELDEYRVSNQRLRDLAQQALDDKNTAAARATNQYARLHAERDGLFERVKRARARHTGVCSGACGLDDACECEDRDLICGEDNERWPCPTIRDLDGSEAGR